MSQFGIEDLKTLPNQTGCWDGVRNYQACKEGQHAFFYHSNCKEPGISGVMKIVKESYVDHTVDVQFERMLKDFIPLSDLKTHLQHKAGP
ncbi:unnamed protein product [Coregonus sp. 'balchen']|nr:unnamed protein product [Coregonus sp. 'balchen']